MNEISSYYPPTILKAEILDDELQCISQSGNVANTSEISNKTGVTLSEAYQQALSNGRLYEAATSMMMLDHPGRAGQVIDEFSTKLAIVLASILNEKGENKEHAVRHNGADKTLYNVFKETLINPLTSPTSDQIGRKAHDDTPPEAWILDKLSPIMTGSQLSTLDSNYTPGKDFKDLLTKIKTISAFGTTIWQLMNTNPADRLINEAVLKNMLQPLGLHVADDFGARFDEFKTVTRTARFDDATSRMRSERPPLVEGVAIPVKYEPAQLHGLGFGNVAVKAEDPCQQAALDLALGAKETSPATKTYDRINGIPRAGAPIEIPPGKNMPTRPFQMSRSEIESLPKAYENLTFGSAKASSNSFLDILNAHAFEHGVGINRWQPTGTFSVESNLRGLPSAGSQSGGACDILLALNTLNETRLYDQPKVIEPATLLIAAFMNFGGYHSFAETVPVGMALSNGDDEYNPSSGTSFLAGSRLERDVQRHPELMKNIAAGQLSLSTINTNFFGPVSTDVQHENLYSRVTNLACQYMGAQAFNDLTAVYKAYTTTHAQLVDIHPELEGMGKSSIQTTRVNTELLV